MTKTPAPMPDRTYSPEEVAEILGTTSWWVRQRVRDGKVEHLRLGKARIRFTAAQVAALVDAVTVAPSPAPPARARRRDRPRRNDPVRQRPPHVRQARR